MQDFKDYMERINMFNQAMAIMGFDSEVFAPDGGLAQRAKRAGFFELEVYNMQTSDTMKGFLDKIATVLDTQDDIVKALYKKAKDSYYKKIKIPANIVEEYAKLTEESHDVWRKARKANDFAKFAPYLERIIELDMKKLEYRDPPSGGCKYDILLDDYEDDMTVDIYDKFFATLKETVVPLIKKVMASKKKIDTSFKNIFVDIDTQREISEFISKKIGYDLNRGYIGEAAHPMCMGADSTDVRITTRYDETDFLSSLYSVLHECGHAIYEQNAGDDIAGSYLGGGTSMGIHESQSHFYENVIGRSLEFWELITPELKEILPAGFAHVTPQMFFEAANESKPSLIRVEADELTYSLHVVIRYEIEKMLYSGQCKIADLPQIWNKKYEEYLGLTPPTYADGIMQDVHWSLGYFGYFPTYALGSAYAAQFLFHMKKEMDVDALIRKGDFLKITNWLREKIHKHGSKYTPALLMQKSFGEQLDASHFAQYLTNKYSRLYEL
ncbi:MAG: carboxypeptidase M32 [Defluviitaleaceae bacterium]|nr:carboxypeptidase M32 [Defluviitaleaceae bacterium]